MHRNHRLVVAGVLFTALALSGLSTSGAQQLSGPDSAAAKPHVVLAAVSVETAKPLADSNPNAANSTTASPDTASPVPSPVTTVEVSAQDQDLQDGIAVSHEFTRDDVLNSAGTFGDFTRYLQVLPGVNANNDWTNEIRVRGGDPAENLFVVDGIEIPNINHFALEGSSGGFTSMLDTSDIENVEMTPGNYDTGYSSRLSALVQIRTRERSGVTPLRQVDVGISGVGGSMELPSALKTNGLLAFHRSVLNMATDDIGINGVPIYTNGLAQAEWAPTAKDHLTLLNLSGGDSVLMSPEPCDPGVSSPIRTDYGGVRSTTGLVWEHFPSAYTESVFNASYSMQNQSIGQNWQFDPLSLPSGCKFQSLSVYQEATRDRIGTLSYRATIQKGAWLYSFGVTGDATNFDYQVAQPAGGQSPFSTNPTWTDADNFNRLLTVGQYGQFAQATGRLTNRLTLIAGVREEEFGLTGARFFNPRGSLAFRLSEHQSLNVDFGRSGQLPPTINILSYAQNASLTPISVNQLSVGAQLWNSSNVTVGLQGYSKQYANEPASTEYPSLMLANMVDTLEQQFVWLPLASVGRGKSYGAELMFRARTRSRFSTLASVTYARALYAAADGVWRPGNFDYPVVANVLASYKGYHGWALSARNSYSSGHPYTPFDVALSESQSRPVYDLSQVNAVRANAYDRMDVDLNRDIHLWHKSLNLQMGMLNALGRKNFMGYVWLDNCHPAPGVDNCGWTTLPVAGIPEIRVDQMHAFPDASVKYVF